MVDSISVIGPGWRATDNNGDLITDGVLHFFDAGTTNAKTVYSDAALSTSLGTTVSCNSAGYPVTSGNVKTLIYVGTAAYKIRLTSTIFGGTVWEHDNVKGALDTSTFLTSAAVADIDIVPVSANRTVTTADKGKLLNVNCSAGTIVITLDPADDLGDGFSVGIRHDGTANQVRIIADGTDEFAIPGVNAVAFALTGRGQSIWIASDGVGFKTYASTSPFINGTIGVITVADRLSSPPGSSNPGERYIVTSAPSGAWSSFAEHDIAEANGAGGWFRYTPPTDCGWEAYVQDENAYYSFIGSAWATLSDTTPGRIQVANASDMESATDLVKAVNPGRQHRHPGHPKFWARINVSGGVPSLAANYNVTSITDTAQGRVTITIATDFSSANWCCVATVQDDGDASYMGANIAQSSIAAGSVEIRSMATGASANATLQDPQSYHVAGLGDQA